MRTYLGWAADFFTVQTLSFKTLYVFFFTTHARRRIEHFNVTAHPTAPWVWRQLLEATPWGQQPPWGGKTSCGPPILMMRAS